MRKIFVAVVAAVSLAYVVPAEAGETYLGTIIVQDAGTGSSSVHNLTANDGGGFFIAPGSLLTVQPSAAAYVCVDNLTRVDAGLPLSDGGTNWVQLKVPTCSTSVGLKVAADTALPTSCQSTTNVILADGGVNSCTVSCVPSSGASVNCVVFQRRGNEM